MVDTPLRDLRILAAIGAGGVAGTALRIAATSIVGATGRPWATLVVNVLGSLLLGLLVVVTAGRDRPVLTAGLGTGLLGSFTTFSAFAVDGVRLAETAPAEAATYVVLSVGLGLGAAGLGAGIGRLVRAGDPPDDAVPGRAP